MRPKADLPPVIDASTVREFEHGFDSAMAVSHFRRVMLPPIKFLFNREPEAAAATWPYTVLLWKYMWRRDMTLLHIPKTGGSTVELVDPMAPALRLNSLLAVRHRNGSKAMALRNGNCVWWPRVHDSTARTPNVIHLTPAMWSRCFGSSWQPYVRGKTYCAVRDPVDRFVSEFLFARLHWFWPARQCPLKHPWERRRRQLLTEMHCFARLTVTILESFDEQWRAGGSLNLTELLTHLLPQHSYVVDEQGQPTCDVVFSFEDVAAARLLSVNRIDHLRENGGAPRLWLKRYAATNSTLLALLHRAYPRDFELYERVKAHQRPTEQHATSVKELADSLFRSNPRLPMREPSCDPASCDCPACCKTSYNMSFAPRFGCLHCVMSHPECGGLGKWKRWSMPRSMGALCGGEGISCNTCEACCEAPWVESSGATCLDCEAAECGRHASSEAGGSADETTVKLHPEPHEQQAQVRKQLHAFRLAGVSTDLQGHGRWNT